MIWEPVTGFEAFYSASEYGDIRRDAPGRGACKPGALLKTSPDKHGYLRVKLCKPGKTALKPVHQIVGEAFIGLCPPGWEWNHIDTDKQNNHYTNLERLSKPAHRAHTKAHGLYASGDRNPSRKASVIAKRSGELHFAHTRPEVYDAIRGENHWTRRNPEAGQSHAAHMNATRRIASGTHNGVARFDAEDIRAIRILHDSGTMTKVELARKYRCKRDTIVSIVTRKSYKDVLD